MSDIIFNDEQLTIINALSLDKTPQELIQLLNSTELSKDDLVLVLTIANALYRAGFPCLDDSKYDVLTAELSAIEPTHPFLTAVEPEMVIDSKTVPLPQKMLSTDKAYSFEEIKKWVDKIVKTAKELNIADADIEIRVTPKLDGYAAYDDGSTLYTRGDGVRGQDITRAMTRGLQVANAGARGLGAGEIVIKKSYFDAVLSKTFENSRNIQAAIIAEKNVDPEIQKAINDGACVFYPFSLLENWTGHYQNILTDFENIIDKIWHSVDYDIDGVILEATSADIKTQMGATRRHHRWQIAFKVNNEFAEVEVIKVTPQTSRTGRITPVAELKPTKLSGATLSRATVHHYQMVKDNGVGPGAVVRLVRSGLVIPKIEKVIKAATPDIPEKCPSCGSELGWDGDHIFCLNKVDCPAQTENTFIHFFKTLGNNDGFGPKVIEKISSNGVKHIHEIYKLDHKQLVSFGFGDKTAQNLIDQLRASRELEIEDWRFMAAFGVSRLGRGGSEKLLEHYLITELFDLSAEQIAKVDGFADVTAATIVAGLANIRESFFAVYNLGFNLTQTLSTGEDNAQVADSSIAGKTIVFTGTMVQGSRSDMEKQAKVLGAKVSKSVSGKTDYLVAGEKVGATKINAATDKGVTVLTEAEYLEMLG